MLKTFETYKDKKILIHCSRGGLRSGMIAAFLASKVIAQIGARIQDSLIEEVKEIE